MSNSNTNTYTKTITYQVTDKELLESRQNGIFTAYAFSSVVLLLGVLFFVSRKDCGGHKLLAGLAFAIGGILLLCSTLAALEPDESILNKLKADIIANGYTLVEKK